MYKIPLGELKEKILATGKVTEEQLNEKIKTKVNDLSGLISEEGAAHIIANELGIEIASQEGNTLKIKEVYSGMRNITTAGKVTQKFDVREFTKDDKTGKVCTLILGDETGRIRVVFWNDQVDQLENVNLDDILLVKDAYVRENNGGKEIHLGSRGGIEINPPGITINSVRQASTYERKKIQEIADESNSVELMGTVVQVFDPRFFLVHPETGKRIREGEDTNVTPALSYVLNAVLDDGTGTMRAVFWKNQTNHFLGVTEEDMQKFKDNLAEFENVKTDLLGEQFKVLGRVKKNEMFDRLEFIAQIVEKANPEEELAKLQTE